MRPSVLVGVLLCLLGLPPASGAEEVVLKSRRFVPAAGISDAVRRQAQRSSGRVHVILQLDDVPTVERRIGFIDAGVRLLAYLPHRAWLASFSADRLVPASALPGVRAITEILPEDKIAPALRETGVNTHSMTDAGHARLVAVFFTDVTHDAAAAMVDGVGGIVLARDAASNSLVLELPAGRIGQLASRDGVKWIDQHYPSRDLNDGARAAMNVGVVQLAPYGLTGAGVMLGQWESKHPDDTHADLAGRVLRVEDEWPVGDHATQVAGTMIGDGRLLNSRQYRGMATAAELVSYHSWDDVADLRGQYRQAIERYGLDIANNSWGKVEWHVYKDYAAALDGIVRGSLGKPVSMVWAAGNEGGWGTILCTAVAKNVVAVGATNSDDDSLWPWSNKGPTEDGRIKPDLVAPGCEVRAGGSIWSTLPDNRYGGACGTSLAAPSVSGVMALVLEDWRGTHGADPRPSTLKGILMHTATDLGNPGPDYAYGYGLVNAVRAVELVRDDTIDELVVEELLLQQGERDLYTLDVPPGEPTLKVTLVWDDFEADPLAAHALVNDLDLVVTGPDGRRHYPWTLNPYVPSKGAERTQADHTNNVEQVEVDSPAAGTWLIAVWATGLPQYYQTYSLLTDTPGLSLALPGTSVFSVSGALGQTVAQFDDTGNLVLQGALTTGAECEPPAGAFVIKSPDQEVVGYVDLEGNMSIRGELNELSHCRLTGGGLLVHDWFGHAVAYVDAAGNLCLAGRLYQNP
jgi:hypothetical protein